MIRLILFALVTFLVCWLIGRAVRSNKLPGEGRDREDYDK